MNSVGKMVALIPLNLTSASSLDIKKLFIFNIKRTAFGGLAKSSNDLNRSSLSRARGIQFVA